MELDELRVVRERVQAADDGGGISERLVAVRVPRCNGCRRRIGRAASSADCTRRAVLCAWSRDFLPAGDTGAVVISRGNPRQSRGLSEYTKCALFYFIAEK